MTWTKEHPVALIWHFNATQGQMSWGKRKDHILFPKQTTTHQYQKLYSTSPWHGGHICQVLIFCRDVISLLAWVFVYLIDRATQEVPMKNIWMKLSVKFLRYTPLHCDVTYIRYIFIRSTLTYREYVCKSLQWLIEYYNSYGLSKIVNITIL